MSQIETFESDDFILGPDKPISVVGTLKAGTSVARLTPVMTDATGLLLPWDGSPGKAVGLAAFAVTASSNTEFSHYVKGSFRSSSIPWPQVAGTTPHDMTDLEKQTAFAGTAISVG
ncbi:head decoration protein [Citrobacter sp. S2-9]|uniref:Head decoration protein n=1 Tax=Citrobacter enshiensis TaxID=2971264 RepID=A0ABT8PRQ9_9ENTR|nr:head decoration protein [Citrobacter enshiensis]MDN8599022.1 head decoration protein [Citrobacter enshiensis]